VPSLSNAAMTDVIRANGERAGAKYYAEVVTNAGTVLGKFLYSDDGRGADAKANDGIFSARWQLPVQHKPALGKSTSLTVKTTAVLANDELREAFDGIQYSHPGAALTGRFRDLVRDGNLVVQAEVNIVKPGRYFLEGALAYPGGESISTAQVAKSFSSAGNYWMDLSYYGLIFHDRRASGRLQLASVTLTDVNELESILGPVLTNVHLTQALNKAKLTRQSFNDPEMLEKASRIEASLAKRQHSTE
ncbi:MAG: choice-of-anchor X domain-containing protein, partial [Arenimonas sp.]